MDDGTRAVVLLVEPDHAIREWIADILGKAGYQVQQVPEIDDPVAFAEQVKPQVIVTGTQVKTRAGTEVMVILEKNPLTADIPVVLYRIPKQAGLPPATSTQPNNVLLLPQDFPILADAVARVIGKLPPA